MTGQSESGELQTAGALWKTGRFEQALAAAWRAFEAAPDGLAEKRLIARILQEYTHVPDAGRATVLQRLVSDPDVEPANVSSAGWCLLTEALEIFRIDFSGACEPIFAKRLETNDLAITLLAQDFVTDEALEEILTKIRRWLLLSGQRDAFPRLADALMAQAALNGGAWPFDAQERTAFAEAGDFARAYLPVRDIISAPAAFDGHTTRAVAAQYEGWPYPQWTRVGTPPVTTLAAHIHALDPAGPDTIATPADILVAGCGTGRQVVLAAKMFPQSHITAIDISAASLRYAARRCEEGGIAGVDFRVLDLHQAATMGRSFDAIICTGVLHHLPEPERGWAALAQVLKPGGVMHVMVYSKIARLKVRALRQQLSGLAEQPMSDDVLREVRRFLRETPGISPPRSRDFYNLAGVYDLLMHSHEDPFDLPRLKRALNALGLKLIHFVIPSEPMRARYRRDRPDDALQRDFAGWSTVERAELGTHARMYDLWCRNA